MLAYTLKIKTILDFKDKLLIFAENTLPHISWVLKKDSHNYETLKPGDEIKVFAEEIHQYDQKTSEYKGFYFILKLVKLSIETKDWGVTDFQDVDSAQIASIMINNKITFKSYASKLKMWVENQNTLKNIEKQNDFQSEIGCSYYGKSFKVKKTGAFGTCVGYYLGVNADQTLLIGLEARNREWHKKEELELLD